MPNELKKGANALSKDLAAVLEDAEFPDLKAILCQFMRLSGGANGVARMLKREYKSARPGSTIRAMILQMILQGSKAISAKETTRDNALISDEDLAREMERLVAKQDQGNGPA